MFQNLANFLLSSVRNNQVDEPSSPSSGGVEINTTPSSRLSCSASEAADDDWVLVDDDGDSADGLSDADDLDLLVVTVGDVVPAAPTLPCLVSNMDESWFVTPPPCFISAGPVHMETSPLENLLIEHPSMSVYTHHGRRHLLGLSRVASPARSYAGSGVDDVDEEDEDDEEVEVEDALVGGRGTAGYNHRVHLIQQQERQGLKSKQAQKVQIKQTCKSLQRGHMDRNNKAREVNSRNRRQRRGERSQGAQRSCVNNNRKC